MERKSFIIHKDSLEILDELDFETSGKLFHAIKNYQKDGSEPEEKLIKLLFFNFKKQFIRDADKYSEITERNKINGQKGGRPTKPKETQITQSVFEKPKKADSDSDSDSKNDSDSVSDSESKKDSDNDVNIIELELCKTIALKDDKWVRLAKANETELDAFNDHLILIGLNKKLPIDYKRHFVNWKKQKPEILSKINNLKRDDSW
jgi:hypothetical protein